MKNPFLSLWMSGANAWAGAARGMWMGEMQRQQSALFREMMKQSVRFWSGAWMLPEPARRSRKD